MQIKLAIYIHKYSEVVFDVVFVGVYVLDGHLPVASPRKRLRLHISKSKNHNDMLL
jgi:hypothetical protein